MSDSMDDTRKLFDEFSKMELDPAKLGPGEYFYNPIRQLMPRNLRLWVDPLRDKAIQRIEDAYKQALREKKTIFVLTLGKFSLVIFK